MNPWYFSYMKFSLTCRYALVMITFAYCLLFSSSLFAKGLLGLEISNPSKNDGALIMNIKRGSPALAAGMMPGDIITEISGTKISSSQNLINDLSQLPAGAEVDIKYRREYLEYNTKVTLGIDDTIKLPSKDNYAELIIIRPSRFTSGAISIAFWLNGEFVGHMTQGIIRLKIPPGHYKLHPQRAKCGSCFGCSECSQERAPAVFDVPNSRVIPQFEKHIKANTVVILEYVVSADGRAGKIESFVSHPAMPDSAKGLEQVNVPEPNLQLIYSASAIPRHEMQIFNRCMKGMAEFCQNYSDNYTDPLMLTLIGQPLTPNLNKSTVRQTRTDAQQAALASIPPTARRDALMVRISELIKSGKHAATLPLFEDLVSLPVVLDPNLDYFWGKALLEANRQSEGVDRLYRYVERKGTDSAYYQDALRAINKIEYRL